MKKYYRLPFKKVIQVKDLITIEYLDLSETFSYPDEAHKFCEFTYVDNGSLICSLDNEKIQLNQGDFFLTLPNTHHSYSAQKTATILVLCFDCTSAFTDVISGKINVSFEEKKIISKIILEAKSCFKFPFDKKLEFLEQPYFASLQLLENYIEQLLIMLVRNKLKTLPHLKFIINNEDLENNIACDIKDMLKNNIYNTLYLEDICKKIFFSKTYINTLFKNTTGHTIKQYYNLLKINEAKELIKQNIPLSSIAEKLCFESSSYFSKVFMRYTNMTPNQFRKSIL